MSIQGWTTDCGGNSPGQGMLDAYIIPEVAVPDLLQLHRDNINHGFKRARGECHRLQRTNSSSYGLSSNIDLVTLQVWIVASKKVKCRQHQNPKLFGQAPRPAFPLQPLGRFEGEDAQA